MKIKIDPQRLKLKHLRGIEKNPSAELLIDILATTAVDENGAAIPEDKAREIAEDMTLVEVTELLGELKDAADDLIPPTKGGR
jgi:hypothetical protein